MGGVIGFASKQDCVMDLFFGTDYHSHLGTKRGGMCILQEDGFNRSILDILFELAPERRVLDIVDGTVESVLLQDTHPASFRS